MRDKLNIPVIPIGSNEIEKYEGAWVILSLDRFTPNNIPNKVIISGPSMMPKSASSDVIFNGLSEWVVNLVKSIGSTKVITIPFPLDYDNLKPNSTSNRTQIILYPERIDDRIDDI